MNFSFINFSSNQYFAVAFFSSSIAPYPKELKTLYWFQDFATDFDLFFLYFYLEFGCFIHCKYSERLPVEGGKIVLDFTGSLDIRY